MKFKYIIDSFGLGTFDVLLSIILTAIMQGRLLLLPFTDKNSFWEAHLFAEATQLVKWQRHSWSMGVSDSKTFALSCQAVLGALHSKQRTQPEQRQQRWEREELIGEQSKVAGVQSGVWRGQEEKERENYRPDCTGNLDVILRNVHSILQTLSLGWC